MGVKKNDKAKVFSEKVVSFSTGKVLAPYPRADVRFQDRLDLLFKEGAKWVWFKALPSIKKLATSCAVLSSMGREWVVVDTMTGEIVSSGGK